MKKSILKLLCAVLVLTTLLCLAGCAMGTYKLKSASALGLSVDLEDIGMDPDDCYLEMSPFGSGVLCINGEEHEFEYDEDEIKFTKDGRDFDYEIEDNKIIVDYIVADLIFEK